VYTPILPVMVQALGLSSTQAGMIASANFIGYLAGAIAARSQHIRGSQRSWLLAALAINAVAIAATGATADLGHQLVLRFVSGVASAFILIFASSLVLDHPTAASEGLSSLHFAGVGFGIVISAATVAFLSYYGANWSWLWFVNGAICIFLLVGVATLVADDRVVPERGALKPRDGQLLKIGLLALAYGLFGFGYVITATFLVAIVRRSQAIAPLEPWIWILFGISAIPSVAFWNHLSSRWGTLNTFAIACLIEAIGVAASLIESAVVGVLLAAVFLGGTFMGLTALGLTAARKFSTGDPRRNIALMTAAFGTGQIVGPALAGVMADQLGGFIAPTLAAAISLVIAASLALWARH
jgi:MFS family permease